MCVLLLREVADFESAVLWLWLWSAVKVVSAAAVVPVPALEVFILSLWCWLVVLDVLYVLSCVYIVGVRVIMGQDNAVLHLMD